MKKAGSARLFLFVKAIITVSLIAAICTKIDISMLSRHLDGGGALYFLLGLSLLALNDVIVATRWWLLLRRLNVETVSLGYAIAATYSSVFVGQVLPGTVGSDAVRGWFCYDRGTSLRVTVISLLTDRLLALVGVVVVAGVAWFWQFETLAGRPGQQIAVLGTLVVAVALAALWLLPAFIGKLTIRWGRLRTAYEMPATFRFTALSRAGAFGLALSCVIIALTVNAVILFGRGFGVDVIPSVAFLVVPVALIFSSLPISIGGWGVREASLAYGLTLFGKAPEDAVMVGLALGIGLLLSSLPGAIATLALALGRNVSSLRRTGSDFAEETRSKAV